ncbi:hypothetical protein L917_07657 [Phytophthora nicotianae]|uniref:Uncharacterized protein n=1 Tax=Phytophthora nicotianae TaxID=4792 RepID=W2GZL6_PHYNI|nr:hypothetical protein L915_07845 [Phytophthora nicotianae]ETL94352.1 hypothetical protein L917_07657 [Phytophthora nicotianae]
MKSVSTSSQAQHCICEVALHHAAASLQNKDIPFL